MLRQSTSRTLARKGFTLGELLLVLVGLAFFAFVGWGISFAFASNVFIPWIGVVPPEYHNLASFVSAFFFDGIFTFVTVVTVALGGLGLLRLFGGKKRRR